MPHRGCALFRGGWNRRTVFLCSRRGQEIEPDKRREQHGKQDSPDAPSAACPLFLLLFKHRICFQPGGALRCLQRDLPGTHRNRAGRTHLHACAAVNALMVAHMPHIHRTLPDACTAAGAVFLFHPDSNKRKAAEESVDRAERAQEAAEGPVAEHTGEPDHQENDPFPGKEDAEHGKESRILFIGQESHCAFQRACRADILAERGKRQVVPESVPERKGQNKDRQNDIFEQ